MAKRPVLITAESRRGAEAAALAAARAPDPVRRRDITEPEDEVCEHDVSLNAWCSSCAYDRDSDGETDGARL